MARTVNIGFNIGTGNSIENLKKIRTELAGIREEVNKKIDLEIHVDSSEINEAIKIIKKAKEITKKSEQKDNFISAFSGDVKKLDLYIEQLDRKISSIGESNKFKSTFEQIQSQMKFLRSTLADTSKDIDAITFSKLKADFLELTDKLKTLKKEASKPVDIGLKSSKVGTQYSVPNKPFTPAFSSEINKLDLVLERITRTLSNGVMNNKLKSQLETEYLKASYLKDELQKVDKNADSITLNKLKLDLEDSLNKIKTLNSQIKKSNDIGISAPKV